MLWFFVALQAMTPFIHAHAGAVQLNHGGLLHVHQGLHTDAIYHAIATHEHGAEVEVAQGVPARKTSLDASSVDLSVLVNSMALYLGASERTCAVLPDPPLFHPTSPDHARPLALAPPSI